MKILRTLAAIVLLGFAALPLAMAGIDCPWDSEPLVMRTQTSSGDPNDQGYIDSLVFSGSGATVASAQRIDTTRAFGIWKHYIVGDQSNGLATTGDSMLVFGVQITPSINTAVAESADTLLLTLQVSNDGVNWTSCNATQYAVLDPGTSLQFNRNFFTDYGGSSLPDEDSFFGWTFGRLLIQSDSNGEYAGNIRYRECKGAP